MLTTLILTLFLLPESANACSCGRSSGAFDTNKAYKDADMVYLGTVTEILETKVKKGGKDYLSVTYKVEKSWKGVQKTSATLYIPTHMCGTHASKGQKYLVFGSNDPEKNIVCSGGSVAETAGKKIKGIECIQSGGIWARFGLLGDYQCQKKTKDAGRKCTDHSDCESVCMAPNKVAAGTATAGQCYKYNISLGTCMNGVKKGKATGVMCED